MPEQSLPPSTPKTANLVYFLVAVIGLVIATFWVLSMRNRLVSFSWKKSPEKKLYDNVQKQFEESGEYALPPDSGQAKEEAREKLIEMVEKSQEAEENPTAQVEEDGDRLLQKNNTTTTSTTNP